jgi:hypothetical protein
VVAAVARHNLRGRVVRRPVAFEAR